MPWRSACCVGMGRERDYSVREGYFRTIPLFDPCVQCTPAVSVPGPFRGHVATMIISTRSLVATSAASHHRSTVLDLVEVDRMRYQLHWNFLFESNHWRGSQTAELHGI